MFCIIAVQTLRAPQERYRIPEGVRGEEKYQIELRRARHASVMKVLKEDKWYWLARGYKMENDIMVETGEGLPSDFYSGNGPHISLSAIVGENGMGKSSLLELFFRLINNVSYALRDALEVQKYALHFVPDIYARVWIHDDEGIYYFEQQDGVVRIHWQNGQNGDFCFDYYAGDEAEEVESARERLKKLFYTIVVNYSQYAYNTNDYMAEWDTGDTGGESADSLCWLSGLFHKNDGYQTPIVLNPFRESGNININQERDLTQTRLYNLVINDASPLKQILRKKEAKAFIFDIDNDLNPIPGKRYYSQKVVKQMSQMRLLGKRDYKTVNDIGRRITAAWGHVLGYEIESRKGNSYWVNMDDVRTINYIVYKTLKISRNYAQYYEYHDCFGDADEVLEYVGELNKDSSHITLKLRRCLAYLYFHHYTTGNLVNGSIEGNIMTVNEYKEAIDRCYQNDNAILNGLIQERPTFYYYKGPIEPHIWQEEELMPAPSFKTDILIEDENGENVRFSSLSSGEKQMIYSISSVLYQLRNINSVWDKQDQTNVAYKNVCLVFDEIELYAHPKYQLKLICLLIESIKALGLMHVLNVNIILATHSPFVLSDVSKRNVLYLEDGLDVWEKIKFSPFAANVNDTLHQSFFLNEGFLGAFVSDKIRTLCNFLEGKEQQGAWDDAKAEAFIDEVGDPLLKQQLLALYVKHRFDGESHAELAWLRDRVRQLEERHAEN